MITDPNANEIVDPGHATPQEATPAPISGVLKFVPGLHELIESSVEAAEKPKRTLEEVAPLLVEAARKASSCVDRYLQEQMAIEFGPGAYEKFVEMRAVAEDQKQLLEVEVDALKAEIKPLVIATGKTYKGAGITATYKKGSVKWDGKALDAYSKAHPEITAFRSEGEPTIAVSLF